MATLVPVSDPAGMDVINLQGNAGFLSRPSRPHPPALEVEALHRLAQLFAASPSKILRGLVEQSVTVCSADSAGISLEEIQPNGDVHFRWVATAGTYSPYLDALLPAKCSPCEVCLRRKQAQIFTVSPSYLDAIGIDAPPVTDGLLIPWQVDGIRGTLWVVCHHRSDYFDAEDVRLLQGLAYFAAIAVRNQGQQRKTFDKAVAEASAGTARELAHHINNPLQTLMNTVFLAGKNSPEAQLFAAQVSPELLRLTTLVQELLNIPQSE